MTLTAGRRRWPLLVIGASAGSATWSGWVGLGTLTGFGVVHPLPGIWDSLTLNTAITLPIGVEAYAVYALSVATDPAPLTQRARQYAWGSAAAALLLGMAGQIAYHLVDAAGGTRAPWWVVALVSCLPVGVLGAASLLWHLAGQTPPAAESAPKRATESAPAAEAIGAAPGAPASDHTSAGAPPARVHLPTPILAHPEPRPQPGTTNASPVHSVPDAPQPQPDDDALMADVMATDPLPSARQIKATYRIGQARAARIRATAANRLSHQRARNQPQEAADPFDVQDAEEATHPDLSNHTEAAKKKPETPHMKIIKTENQSTGTPDRGETQQESQGTDTHATALP